MNIKKYFSWVAGIVLILRSITSCVQKDDWETPPITCTNKFPAVTTTMADFKAQAPQSGYLLIETDQIFDGYVVSSDENGNFFRTISFQDRPENPTVGLQIEVDRSGNYTDFPIGAHIRINARGLRLGLDRGVVKLGAVGTTFPIGRIPGILLNRYLSGVCSGSGLDVATIQPLKLDNLRVAQDPQYLNMLVQVSNVQFASAELGKTFLNYIGGSGTDTNRSVVDAYGNAAMLRNSAFLTFGSTIVPEGKGDLTFVVSRFNSSWQMLIRRLDDVKFGGSRFFFDGFDGTLDHWFNVNVIGNQIWSIQQFGNPRPCVVMNGFSGRNNANENWLISKPISLEGFTSASLSFDTDVRRNGNPLEVFVTESYTGDPATTVWVPLSAILDPDASAFNTWTNSGDINLDAYVGKSISIAFKYTSTTSAAATWQLDNVRVTGD